MRSLEILLILLPLPYFIGPILSSNQIRPFWSSFSPILGLILFPIHLLLEGYRWQMIPAYFLISVLSFRVIRQWIQRRKSDKPVKSRGRLVSIIGGLTGFVVVGLTAVLPAALPVPRLIDPTGPNQIGTVSYFWVDEERREIFGPSPGGPRALMVQIWYPAEWTPDAEPAPWHTDIETIGPALAVWLGLPPFLLNHLTLAKTHSAEGLPLAASQGQFPLLIFSHGLGGVRMQNTYQMEELASHGYVVAAIDHTYGGAATVFPDGQVAFFDEATIEGDTDSAGNRLIHIWVEDGRFVLDQLERLNEGDSDGRFTDRLRLSQIGYFGHSTGGGTAFLFCQTDERCGVGVALDGWLNPLNGEIAAHPITVPFLFLKAEDWSTPENSAAIKAASTARQTPGTIITLPGTSHYNFTDLPLLSPLTSQMGLAGKANGPETLTIINDYSLAFFNEHLKN